MSTTGIAWLGHTFNPLINLADQFRNRFKRRYHHTRRTFAAFAVFNTIALTAFPQHTNLAVIVRHAPNFNGSGLVEGSVQQLLGESVTLNGGFRLTGDLIVPGTPTLKLNGQPTFAGMIAGSGSASPGNFQVTLNGNCSLLHLRTRTTPAALPTVAAPPQPAGTRTVLINNASESSGDPATLRNLTLNGNAGQRAIPPGTYGNFTANGGSGFTLGIAGATDPAIYNLQNLTLNGQSRLEVIGPVILTIANGFTANGVLGSSNHPTHLQLQLASGGLTLNGGCKVHGNVTAPAGTVIINGNSLLVGSAQCDRLIVNSGGIIRAIATVNQPPMANSQSLSTAEDGALNITLTGSDPEGAPLTYVILNEPAHGTISGTTPNLIYTPFANFDGADSFTFKVNDGQSDSATATISILVSPVNDVPIAQSQTLSTPEDTGLLITLSGSDVENTPLTFEIVTLPEYGELTGNAPNLIYTPNANYNGSDSFTYTASDGAAQSTVATVSISINPIGDAPVASDQTVTTDEDVPVILELTAVDVEGDALAFAVLTPPAHGSLSGTPPNLVYAPATNFNGGDMFTFQASDGLLNSEFATVTLVVRSVNDLPIGTPQTVVTTEDTATNLVLNAIDADGDSLSYRLESQPMNGTFSGTAPELVFSPAADFHGTNIFTFVAVDGASTSAPIAMTLIVAPVNDPPVAEAQTLSVVEDTATAITLTGSDVDNGALIYGIVQAPTNGVLTLDPQAASANIFTYAPNTNFHGADSFTFKLNDGTADSAPATVTLTITPVNDPPENTSQSVSTDEDNATTVTLTATDAENDPLTFAVFTPPSNGTLTGTAPHLTYTPHANFYGIDSFTYQSDDGTTNSEPTIFTITVNPVNDVPEVTAGPDLRITVGAPVQLSGAATDDATPAGIPLALTWSVSSGAGVMQFDAPGSAVTMARFDEVGTYVVRLTANDSMAEAYDEATITVLPMNRAPVIVAGPKQLVLQPASAHLTATISDDGLPEGAPISVAWSKLSGPGNVNFSNPTTKDTAASFSATGDYVLRLTANDSDLSSFADVRVAVRTPAMNESPTINVGNNLVIGLTNAVALNAAISDDGLPQGTTLSVVWSPISGPGGVTFSSATSTNTRATFSEVGTYVLRATVSDSELTAAAELRVTVYPYNQPPEVDAGEDQIVTLPDPGLLYPNPFSITNVNVSLSRSLYSVDRWNNAIGQPGMDDYIIRNSIAIADDIFVTGHFQHAGSVEAHGSARWDGSTWHALYDPRPHLNDNYDATITNIAYFVYDCGTFAFCNQTLECVGARGQEAFVGGLGKNLAYSDSFKDMTARWSGMGWESWVFKHNGGQVRVIKATEKMVYLGGYLAFQPTNATDLTFTNLPWSYSVATWDGTNWGTLGSGVTDFRDTPASTPGLNSYRAYVTSMAIATNGDVYAAGEFIMATPTGYASNVVKWDGNHWQPLGSGLQQNSVGLHVTGMALADNGDLYVGGTFTNAGGYAVRNIARWDGTRWWPLGAGPANGVNGTVEAVAILGRDIYVGGSFSEAGGLPANDIAKWNGQFWSPLGHASSNGTLGGGVFSLAVDNTALYVGGMFTTAGGLPANNIAKWEFSVPPVRGVELSGSVTDDGLPYGSTLSRQWTKISGPGEVTFAAATSARTSATFSQAGTYVLRLTADDSDLTGQDDVTVTIRANQPPSVSAGPDHVIGLEEPLALNGYVADDGLPEGAPVHHVWQQIYGPGTVTFDNAGNTNVTARFSQQGTYVLRLSANDSHFTTLDEITVIVRPRNNPPGVFPGSSANITFGNSHTINATVSDDGNPTNGTLSSAWSVFSGPGQVTFNDARLVQPTVSFSTNGVYILRLTATDSELTSTGHVQLTVNLPANSPPLVNAGTNQTITNLTTRLQGSVSDDGKLLASALDVFWSRSGTGGTVTFANSNSPTTAVSFSQSGIYILTLTAKDGTYTASDSVTITIPNQPPLIVDAGPDRSITLPTNSITLTGYALDTSASTVSWTRLSGPGSATFTGAATLTPTITFSTTGTNVIRLRVSDAGVPYDDTMTLVVAPAGNIGPVVSAGSDQTVVFPTNTVRLNGTVADDGLPIGNAVTTLWTQVAGPTATISSPSSLTSEVTLTGTSMHIFRLSAHDGSLTNGDEIVVSVLPFPNQPPQVAAGSDVTIRVTNSVALSGIVTDDALPAAGGISAFWRELSGPGMVTFGSPATNAVAATNLVVESTVSFSQPGTYVLRLQADDSEFMATDDLTVTVLDVDDNQPPIVNAGLDSSTVAYAPFILSGSVTDDGLPVDSPVSVIWSFVSGPARVYFSDATALMPYAQFTLPGTYRLRLLANDGRLTAFDDVVITVGAPANQPPFVFAGLPLEVTRPSPARLQGVVLDDGLPLGYPLSASWSTVSGPGTVTFLPNANDLLAAAYFSAPGEYILRLQASDSEFTMQDTVTVTVLPGTNAPPQVNAGPDFAATLSVPANLTTSVSDDGLENGLLLVSWSAVSGPGSVAFSTINGDYRATFATTGDYLLRLAVSDGTLTNSDEVAVTVYDEPSPIAEIFLPTDSQIVTAPSAIVGTASSAILQSYVIEYRLAPPDSLNAQPSTLNWSILSSNSVSIVSNTLAVFDPTLLLNGIYELRLTATDVAGRSTVTEPITVIVDRNLKIGHFTISFNDLAVPVPGLPLQITRTYDSRAAAAGIQGDFGIGWSLDIKNVRLQKNRPLSRNWEQTTTGSPFDLSLAYHLNGGKPRIVTITFPDGRVEKFQFVPNPMDQALFPIDYPQWRFIPLGNTRGSLVPAGYDEPDGNFLFFAGNIPGTADLYDLNYFTDWLSSSATEEELRRHPTLFRYTTPEGYKYLIDEIAGLQSVTDPNNNTLLISSNGLTWTNSLAGTNSLSIAFQRDSVGRITNIVDAAGNSMSYAFGITGDLVSYSNRDGETNSFTYDDTHRLLTLTDARGVQVLENGYDGEGRLISSADALGNTTGYFHDMDNQRDFVTNRLGFVTIKEYDAFGNVTRVTDPVGAVSSFIYDFNGNLLVKSNASDCACAERFTYDAADNKTSEIDAAGNATAYTYNSLGKIVTVVDPSGFGTTNTYDAGGNLLSTRDSAGQVTTFTYNNLGKVTSMTDSKGVTSYGYNQFGFLTAQTNALGHVTEYTVDANGNMLSQAIGLTRITGLASLDKFKRGDWLLAGDPVVPPPPITNTARLVMRYEYTDGGLPLRTLYYDGSSSAISYVNGQPNVTTDALGRETKSEYDETGRLKRKTHPGGCAESFEYDAEGQLIASTDKRGYTTRFEYSPQGRLIRTTFPDGSQISATYYLDGSLHTETSKSGEVTTYGLDANRNRITVTDSSGTNTYTYNYRNHVTSKTDPLGRTTLYVYDGLGRNTEILYPDGHTKRASFSGRLVTSETDQNGGLTRYDYDPLGRLISVTDPMNGVTTFVYDELGNKVWETDALNRSTYFEYDSMRRLVKTIYPDGSRIAMGYDLVGRLVSQTTALGDVTTFGYDPGDHLTSMTNALGHVTSYTYDCSGNKLSQTDADGKVTVFEYDALNRLTETTFPCGTTEINTYGIQGWLKTKRDQAGKVTTFDYSINNRLKSVTDPLGNITSFGYDAMGNRTLEQDALDEIIVHEYDEVDRLIRTTYPDGGIKEFSYDPVGRLIRQTEQNGKTWSYAYDALGRMLSETDPAGLATRYTYDAVGNRLSMIDRNGRATRYHHDLMGRVLSTDFPDGSTQSTTYDKGGFPVTATDALGKVTIFEFDGMGQRTSVTDPLGHVTSFGYDPVGRLASITDAKGDTTYFGYDCLGRLATTTYPDNSFRQTVYAANGRPFTQRDPNGNTTTFLYDDAGRLLSQTDPLGNATTFAYDNLGRLLVLTDALGRKTAYEYDELGRRTRIIYPDNTFETATYDLKGRQLTQTDRRNHTTRFGYDDKDRLISLTDALNHATHYSYDAMGRLTSVTDANNHSTTYDYDAQGRLVLTTYADGTTRAYTYDLRGQRKSETDQAGNVREYGYDDAGRLTAITDALDQISTFTYDTVGRLASQTDAAGHTTGFKYNNRGWRTERTLPGGQSEILSYDFNGNLTSRKSFKGYTTTYVYDALNRLTNKIPDVALAGAAPVTFSYTAVGARESMADASGITTYAYDPMDRLLVKETPQGTLTYTYNPNGSVGSISSSSSNGTIVSYVYDEVERLATVTDGQNGLFNYTYDPVGNLTGCSQPNGLIQTYAHDELNRLTELSSRTAQSTTVAHYQYTLGPAGHRRAAIETIAATLLNPQATTNSRAFDYDALYRLNREDLQVVGATSYTASLAYTYDAVGNRQTRTSTLSAVPSAAYAYDANDRLSGDGYDANGNTTNAWVRDPLSVLTNQVSDLFDFEDHLVERQTTRDGQPVTINLVYDGDGNRVRKIVTTTGGTVTTLYLVDDRNPTGYAQVLEELTQDALFSVPTVTRVYTYGLSLLSQDQLVEIAGPNVRWSTSYYGTDGHGSVRYLTDTNGVITDTYDYDAFGNLIVRTGDTPNHYLFAGEQFDPDLNLYYLRARYADPDRGRFWTQDSFEGFGDDPASWHKYTFNQNDPVNRIDPSGHFSLSEGLAVSTLSPLVRGMALQQFDAVNRYSYGLAGGSALKATSRTEAYLIDSLSQGTGWLLGKQEFWATAKGAPYLLAWNPNIATTAKPCWYECVPFDLDVPIYGPGAKHPIFEFEQSELLTELTDVKHGSMLGATLRAVAESYNQDGTKSTSTAVNFMNNMQGSLYNMAGNLVSPQSYVDGYRELNNRAELVMAREFENGAGDFWAGAQGLSSLVGDVVGYNSALEAGYGVDRQHLQLLQTSDRWSRGFMALSQAAMTMTGGMKGFNPEFRSLRLSAPKNLAVPKTLVSEVAEGVCQKPNTPQLAIQERVKAAIAQSKAARMSSRFDEFDAPAAKSAEQLEFGFVPFVERQTFARDFYRSTTGKSDSEIWSHMRGIDFNHPVTIEQIPAGVELIQYKFPKRPTGNYFAYPGTPAVGLGIDPNGRIGAPYITVQDLQALQSVAADTRPLLSVPPWARGPGGRKQLFIPNAGGVRPN